MAHRRGARHPLTRSNDTAWRCSVSSASGEEGPEIEPPYYNFDALNIPENHPARDMQDTFWLPNGMLLRSHTTTVQARVLEKHPPLPIKVVAAGRVYRNEAVDATPPAMFHQFEGIWVEEGLTFGDLKGLLSEIATSIYGEEHVPLQAEVLPVHRALGGHGHACTVCAQTTTARHCRGAGWVTILGSGMIHPKVLEFGYDHTKLSGIAFGIGTTRMAAERHAVPYLRALYEGDLRLLHGSSAGARREGVGRCAAPVHGTSRGHAS